MGSVKWVLGQQSLEAQLGVGLQLKITWRVGAERQIALVRMPVMVVNFEFNGADASERYTFMKRFDLYMQRGGG